MNNRFQILSLEWNEDKNAPLRFEELTKGSSREVWWKCSAGHEWKARFSNRVNGNDCPYCRGMLPIQGKTDLKTCFPDLASEWNTIKNGDKVPSDFLPGSNQEVWWKCKFGHEWKAKINNRTYGRTNCPYCVGTQVEKGKNDLETCFPLIAKEWHGLKNGDLHPSDVSPKSNRSVWWCCLRQHEWKTKICHRVEGTGCPYCQGLLPIPGETDLATLFPWLVPEWHPKRNGSHVPTEYTGQSHQRVWWICPNGHEWQATIATRSNGRGCPVCSGRVVLAGFNDLASIAPGIAMEWDLKKNGELKPEQVTAHSNKNVWWIGKCGHEWQATVNNRVNGTGCPYCNQKRLIPNETSLAVRNPRLAKQWDQVKNAPVTPRDVTEFCNNKYWWICEKGHRWKATVSNRSYEENCPYCAHRLAIPGETDLETINPKLAAEWHPTKNKESSPNHYLPMSNDKVWWKCEKGHEWEAVIFTRSMGSGCPYCAGVLAIPGENDLETVDPELASEWHPTKNKKRRPSEFLPMSSYKAWWRCERGHEWESSIAVRSSGSGCPYCAGVLAIPGENDLETVDPELASEWHPTKNKKRRPSEFLPMSNYKAWWQCKHGHEWEAPISSRSKGSKCPNCKKLRKPSNYLIP